jgi:hypothetical protein
MVVLLTAHAHPVSGQLTATDLRIKLTGDAVANREYTLEINIGQVIPVNNLHGLSFRIRSKSPNTKFVEQSVGLGPFLGGGVLSIRRKIDDQNVDVAVTRTDGVGANGTGIIGWIGFITTLPGTASFEITDIKGVTPAGTLINLEGKQTEVPVLVNTSMTEDTSSPESFRVYPNYPNPFNPTTTIRYALPEAAQVRLSVFNLLGQEVAVLVNGMRPAGISTVNFDASTLSSGVYIYRLTDGTQTITRKLLLVK